MSPERTLSTSPKFKAGDEIEHEGLGTVTILHVGKYRYFMTYSPNDETSYSHGYIDARSAKVKKVVHVAAIHDRGNYFTTWDNGGRKIATITKYDDGTVEYKEVGK